MPGDAMKELPRRRKSVRRAEILAAAREVFLEYSFERASVGEIAARAGCVEGTIYSYFVNKRDLYDAVITDFYDRLIADIEPRFAAIDGTEDRLRFLIARHLQIVVDDPGTRRLLTPARIDEAYFGSNLHRLNRRFSRFMARTIADGMARGELRADLDPQMARDFVYGGVEHWLASSRAREGRFEPARIAREMTAMLMGGWASRQSMQASVPDTPRALASLEQRLARVEGQLRRRGAHG
jgi:AcrR family transcriptional regulator